MSDEPKIAIFVDLQLFNETLQIYTKSSFYTRVSEDCLEGHVFTCFTVKVAVILCCHSSCVLIYRSTSKCLLSEKVN